METWPLRLLNSCCLCQDQNKRLSKRSPSPNAHMRAHTLFCGVFYKYTRCIWETSTSSCSLPRGLERCCSKDPVATDWLQCSKNRNFLKLLSRLTQLACGVKWFSLGCSSLSSWARPQICRWDYLSDLIQTRSLEMNAHKSGDWVSFSNRSALTPHS